MTYTVDLTVTRSDYWDLAGQTNILKGRGWWDEYYDQSGLAGLEWNQVAGYLFRVSDKPADPNFVTTIANRLKQANGEAERPYDLVGYGAGFVYRLGGRLARPNIRINVPDDLRQYQMRGRMPASAAAAGVACEKPRTPKLENIAFERVGGGDKIFPGDKVKVTVTLDRLPPEQFNNTGGVSHPAEILTPHVSIYNSSIRKILDPVSRGSYRGNLCYYYPNEGWAIDKDKKTISFTVVIPRDATPNPYDVSFYLGTDEIAGTPATLTISQRTTGGGGRARVDKPVAPAPEPAPKPIEEEAAPPPPPAPKPAGDDSMFKM